MSHQKHMYDLCKNHMHSYVLAELEDGTNFDGIITGLDEEYVYFAVPIDNETPSQMMQNDPSQMMQNMGELRQFGWYGFGGFPPYGYGFPGFGFPGYGFGPRRRFRRLVLPLAALTALSVLPWY
ncbi:hypothetical protein [Ornithinibacillus scapharcae]|uniref:hypothetical protein n=1 Tax=Ornithinibacillus scapharcae TaxID=1147159 RepID=UPI000225B546